MADSTINELVNLTSVANNDELVLWDTSASETKKATVSNVVTPVAISTVGTTSGIMAMGTCSTAAGTAQKAVTSAKWTNKPGESIMVKFTYKNTADNVTLKIGNNSAIPVYALNTSIRLGSGTIPAGPMIFTLSADGTKFYAHTVVVDTEVTSNSSNLITSGGVANILSNLPTDAVLHYSFDEVPDYPDGAADVRLIDNNTYDIQSTNYRFLVNGYPTTITNNNGKVQFSGTIEHGDYDGVYIRNSYIDNKIVKIKMTITALSGTVSILNGADRNNLVATYNKVGTYTISLQNTNSLTGEKSMFITIDRKSSATVIIDEIYIGDGSYNTPIIDNANGQWNSVSQSGVAVQGVSGKAMSLYNKNVSAGNFNFSQNFTISMWINPFVAYTGNTRQPLLYKDGVIFLCNGSNIDVGNTFELHLVQNGNTNIFTFGSRLPVNQWTSFVLIKNESSIKIYQNGSIISTLSLSTSVVDTSNNNLLLGYMGEGTLPQNISYDDLLIFDRALTEKEVLALYYNKANTPKYYNLNNFKLDLIPLPPSTDGTFQLTATVSNGSVSYSWV